jgi:hypothetical protein
MTAIITALWLEYTKKRETAFYFPFSFTFPDGFTGHRSFTCFTALAFAYGLFSGNWGCQINGLARLPGIGSGITFVS